MVEQNLHQEEVFRPRFGGFWEAQAVETAVFRAFEERKSEEQVPSWAHGSFSTAVRPLY